MVQDEFKVTRLSNFVKYLSRVDFSSKCDPSNSHKVLKKVEPILNKLFMTSLNTKTVSSNQLLCAGARVRRGRVPDGLLRPDRAERQQLPVRGRPSVHAAVITRVSQKNTFLKSSLVLLGNPPRTIFLVFL